MLNYKHLHYFWVAAKEGGITRASEILNLTPQTISGQLSLLEEKIGTALFVRSGRTLELTETGQLVLSYAEEIFTLGKELEEAAHHLPHGRPQNFKVGIAEVVPKSIAHKIIAPALRLPSPIRIVCRESSLDALLADLTIHRLDLVLADRKIPSSVSARAYNHKLGECGITFFATRTLKKEIAGKFPGCLDGIPLLIPGEVTIVRSRLLHWFRTLKIHPRIVGEFDDSALMKVFGRAGTGVFIAPTPIAPEVEKQYGVVSIGQTSEIKEEFFAISVERKITHPAVSAITQNTKQWLFEK